MAKYGQTSKNGGVVVIKKLLGTEEEDKRLFLEAKILHGLQNKNGHTSVFLSVLVVLGLRYRFVALRKFRDPQGNLTL